jgi:hypothetical protein
MRILESTIHTIVFLLSGKFDSSKSNPHPG